MKRGLRSACLLLVLLVVALIAPGVQAQVGSGYDLTWATVDGGGGAASHAGSGYVVMGTIGQPEPGPILTGGDYLLVGGFWSGGSITRFEVYLPLVLRNF